MNKYSGSNFDDFLAEEGILEEVSEGAQKRLLAMQIKEDIMNATNQRKMKVESDNLTWLMLRKCATETVGGASPINPR